MSLSVSLEHRVERFTLNVAFEAPNGVTALFGHSGSGKTTVINAVAGLLKPDKGRIGLNGTPLFDSAKRIDVPVRKRQLGYVFQEARLFPHMSVARNLTYGRRAQGLGDDAALMSRITEMLGLGDLLERAPGDLSGGEKQRVAIGRALLSGPRMLLLDEPLAALDERRKQEILPYLERLRDEAEIPMLYVSHSVSEVARLATTVVTLQDGQVMQAGPVETIFSDPEAAYTLGMRDAGAVLTAQVMAHHTDGLSELAAAGATLFLPRVAADVGETLRVRIRAQDVMLSATRPQNLSALNILEGQVTAIKLGRGPGAFVQVDCGGDTILSRVTRRSVDSMALQEGQRLFAVVKSVSVARGDVGSAS